MAEDAREKLRVNTQPSTQRGLLVEDDTVDEAPISSFACEESQQNGSHAEMFKQNVVTPKTEEESRKQTEKCFSAIKKIQSGEPPESGAPSGVVFDEMKIRASADGMYREDWEYTVVKNVGDGAFGKIYLAEDKMTVEKHAIKKILIKHFNDIEVLALMTLRITDFVPTMYMFQFEIDTVLLHMEYIKGVTLCAAERKLPRDDCSKEFFHLYIFRELLGILEYLHMKIVHADLHGGNIMLVKAAPDVMKVMVIDFGEAKLVNKPMMKRWLDIRKVLQHYCQKNGMDISGVEGIDDLKTKWPYRICKVESTEMQQFLQELFEEGCIDKFVTVGGLLKKVEDFLQRKYNEDNMTTMKLRIAETIFSEEEPDDATTMETPSEDVGNYGDGFAACMPESNDQENLPIKAAEMIFPTVPSTMETPSEDVGNYGDGFAACMPESSGIFMEVTKPKMDDTSQDLGPRCEGNSEGMVHQTSRAVPWLSRQEPLNRVWSFGPVLYFLCLLCLLLAAMVYTGN